MAKKNDDNQEKDQNILYFPDLEKRRKEKQKDQKKQDADNAKKKALEEEYRAQYRAERASKHSLSAQRSSNGSKSFINWDKVPIFTRIICATLIIIHIVISFILTDAQNMLTIYHFGFTPGVYTGQIPWDMRAIIAPFTSLFLHSGWMHLIFNLVMMIVMGVFFERDFGARRTAVFFVLCGLCGQLACMFISPFSTAPVIGASGAISGLFASAFILMTERGMLGPDAQKRGPLPFIMLWLCIMIGLGLISQDVSWPSHVGGFIGGIGVLHLWRKRILRF